MVTRILRELDPEASASGSFFFSGLLNVPHRRQNSSLHCSQIISKFVVEHRITLGTV